jgi:hypothetical protein
MAKYVDMSAKLEIKAEDLFQASVKKTEPPQGGIIIVQDGKVSWKEIKLQEKNKEQGC